jgi:hypothetical protein
MGARSLVSARWWGGSYVARPKHHNPDPPAIKWQPIKVINSDETVTTLSYYAPCFNAKLLLL